MAIQIPFSRPTSDHIGIGHSISRVRNRPNLFDFDGREKIYRAGEQLFAESDPAFFVYKVIRGVVVTSKSLEDGRRKIDAFRLAGDVFGLDIDEAREISADAINDVSVLVARRDTILSRAAGDCDAGQELLAATSRELRRVQRHSMLLAMNARQRVASFLLEMAARLGQPDILTLPMSRQHIADYLGLTIETVSRVLTQFEGAYLIGSRSSRHMILLDQPALRQLIDGRDSAISSRTCETAQARAGAAHLA